MFLFMKEIFFFTKRNVFLHGKNPKQTGKFQMERGTSERIHYRIVRRKDFRDTLAIYPQYMNDDLRVMN